MVCLVHIEIAELCGVCLTVMTLIMKLFDCVSMFYCVLNNITFKIFLKEHMVMGLEILRID